MNKGKSDKLSHLEFVTKAVHALRKEGFEGIHTVYSGFNAAFRDHYGTDPIEATNALQTAGHIVLRPCKGGVYLLLAEDVRKPEPKAKRPKGPTKGEKALADILAS